MSALPQTAATALRLIVSAVLEAVEAAGPTGAPSGVIYAALQTQGCTLNQFQSLMSALVKAGKLTHDPEAHLYFIQPTIRETK